MILQQLRARLEHSHFKELEFKHYHISIYQPFNNKILYLLTHPSQYAEIGNIDTIMNRIKENLSDIIKEDMDNI